VEMRKENIKKLELNLNNLENESNLHIEEYQKKIQNIKSQSLTQGITNISEQEKLEKELEELLKDKENLNINNQKLLQTNQKLQHEKNQLEDLYSEQEDNSVVQELESILKNIVSIYPDQELREILQQNSNSDLEEKFLILIQFIKKKG